MEHKEIVCQYCGVGFSEDILIRMELNVENFGSNIFVVRCNKCGHKNRVSLRRRVDYQFVAEASEKSDLSFE